MNIIVLQSAEASYCSEILLPIYFTKTKCGNETNSVERSSQGARATCTCTQLQCDAAEWCMVFVTVQAKSPCTGGLLSVGSLTRLSLEEPGLRLVSRCQTLRTEGKGLEYGHRATCRPGI